MKVIPHVEYYNLFGPTETNVITYYRVPTLPPGETRSIPIGKPCEGYDVFAVTEGGGVLTQPGESGELYAVGPCIARGYWGDLEKTNSSFVRDPRDPDSEFTAYKTGDIVTLDENNDFEFLGRRDYMVKSRGYRIELGEIESALYGHPDVKEAAVIAISDELVGNRIKAFVALRDAGEITTTELQDFCQKRIPKYMVPEWVEFRKTLPRTSTGKIDKQKLAANEYKRYDKSSP